MKFDDETNKTLRSLAAMALIVVTGVTAGFIVLALFIPLFELGMTGK